MRNREHSLKLAKCIARFHSGLRRPQQRTRYVKHYVTIRYYNLVSFVFLFAYDCKTKLEQLLFPVVIHLQQMLYPERSVWNFSK